MRPPEFTGGNPDTGTSDRPPSTRFNEAAGIHRRKLMPMDPQEESPD